MLEQFFSEGNIAVCIKNLDRVVLMQNEQCHSICGNQLGHPCSTGCMKLYTDDTHNQWKDWGSRVYKNSCVHDNFYDVTLLCSSEHIITFLQPLKDKYEMALAYYRSKGLTRRETEVASLMIRGISNTEICKYLSISRTTLKTHLNNLYRKLRESGETPAFIPACRVSG